MKTTLAVTRTKPPAGDGDRTGLMRANVAREFEPRSGRGGASRHVRSAVGVFRLPDPSASTLGGAVSTEMPEPTQQSGPEDLVVNHAGELVGAQAKALRERAPVRTLFARVLGVHTDERAFRIGAKGERLVADQLDKLPSSWHARHSIPLSETGTDLDHLVTGPGGVFSINAKHHPDASVWVAGGTFLVNGQRQDYVRASRAEGRKVARLLTAACGFEVEVTPVIAVVGAANLKVKEQPADVVVCARRRVGDWLRPNRRCSTRGQSRPSIRQRAFAPPGPVPVVEARSRFSANADQPKAPSLQSASEPSPRLRATRRGRSWSITRPTRASGSSAIPGRTRLS